MVTVSHSPTCPSPWLYSTMSLYLDVNFLSCFLNELSWNIFSFNTLWEFNLWVSGLYSQKWMLTEHKQHWSKFKYTNTSLSSQKIVENHGSLLSARQVNHSFKLNKNFTFYSTHLVISDQTVDMTLTDIMTKHSLPPQTKYLLAEFKSRYWLTAWSNSLS